MNLNNNSFIVGKIQQLIQHWKIQQLIHRWKNTTTHSSLEKYNNSFIAWKNTSNNRITVDECMSADT